MGKKTLTEWAKLKGYRIIDPDGFDRSDPDLYDRLFSEKEFDDGLPYCTVEQVIRYVGCDV